MQLPAVVCAGNWSSLNSLRATLESAVLFVEGVDDPLPSTAAQRRANPCQCLTEVAEQAADGARSLRRHVHRDRTCGESEYVESWIRQVDRGDIALPWTGARHVCGRGEGLRVHTDETADSIDRGAAQGARHLETDDLPHDILNERKVRDHRLVDSD